MQSKAWDKRMEAAFELCWTIQRSFMGEADLSEDKTAYHSILKNKNHRDIFFRKDIYSQILLDGGMSLMCLTENKPYFMLIPEAEGRSDSISDITPYTDLFTALGEKDILESLIMLYKRVQNMPFTPRLLVKRVGVSGERALDIIHTFMKYSLIQAAQIELDDEEMTMYSFNPNPAFAGLLTFTEEIINKPNNFEYFNNPRSKSYL